VQPVLHCFAGSEPGLDALKAEAGPRTWAQRAAGLRPDLALDLDRAVVTTWADEPFSLEAYSALTTDWRPGDDELLRRPVGTLHFAGEHTAGDWAGLMEGALRSGARAAQEVVTGSVDPVRLRPLPEQPADHRRSEHNPTPWIRPNRPPRPTPRSASCPSSRKP
jgi:monoamine oxidase